MIQKKSEFHLVYYASWKIVEEKFMSYQLAVLNALKKIGTYLLGIPVIIGQIVMHYVKC